MTLLEDIKGWYEDESYPPDDGYMDAKLVSEEDTSSLRWGTNFVNVYQRGSELVAVSDVRPATEMQDWGDYGDPDIYPVIAQTQTVVVTKYVRDRS